MKTINAVLFDCDGVLVDSEVISLEVEIAMLGELGLVFERDDYLTRFMGLSTDAYRRRRTKTARPACVCCHPPVR